MLLDRDLKHNNFKQEKLKNNLLIIKRLINKDFNKSFIPILNMTYNLEESVYSSTLLYLYLFIYYTSLDYSTTYIINPTDLRLSLLLRGGKLL